jgi:hypothetical protein
MADTGEPSRPRREPQTPPAPFTFRPLRLIIIILILIVAATIGFHFKSQSDPGTEPSSFSAHPPQYVNAYESNDNIKIAVTVTLGQGFFNVNYDRYGPVALRSQGYSDFDEKIDFTATRTGSGPPGAIIISTSTRPLPASGDFVYGSDSTSGTVSVLPVKNLIGPLGQVDKFAVWFTLPAGQGDSWSGTAFFAPVPIVYQEKGATFGHLPSVGAYSYLYPPSAPLAGEYDTTTGRPTTVSLGYLGKVSAGEHQEYFYVPNSQGS